MGGYYTPPPGGGSGGAAGSLETTGDPVVVSAAAPPANGDVLTATSPTTANWQPSGAGGSLLKIATVTLSGAQLAAINSTPVTAIAAQGANKYIAPSGVFAGAIPAQFLVGSTPYTLYGDLFLQLTLADQSAVTAGKKVNDDLGADVVGPFLVLTSNFGTKANFNNIPLQVRAEVDTSTGRITASNRTAANFGTGYIPTETFPIGGTDAIGVVDTVDGLGAVATYHLSAQGTGISPANAVDCPGDIAGTGLKLDITAIQSVSGGDGTLTLTIPYIVVTLQ